MDDSRTYKEILDATELEALIPGAKGKYLRTSDPSINYNCLAWAVGADWAYFDPEQFCIGYFWPEGVEREWSIPAIRKVLSYFGFKEESDNHDLEEGYIKVAVYVDEDEMPQHFARQLANGKWTSKCGDQIDIEHDTLECLECEDYGKARIYLKRKAAPPA
jgi:hypothetical protein